jgi:cysteinyl-tRNA synthetase
MKLTNTLTRAKQDLQPLEPGKIKLYSCGPTVYQYYHIGNLRNAVFNDILRRTLKLNEFDVQSVMNITDVGHLTSDEDKGDDKLQAQAKLEGKDVWEVAQFYADAFMDDMKRLNVLPTKFVKATDAIDRQIAMVAVLLEKGFAYTAHQAIYFDVTKLGDYGKLTGQKLDQKEVAARSEVVTDPEKRHPWDFALWFFTVGHFKDHAMRWPSPWGDGFPGWHLECSAIIEQELGETIDIHTGGVDHIGTHHTNEIAQSEAAHDGKPLANTWMHIEFLLVDGKKMSKSLGNTYRLQDVTNKGFSPMALRLLYLQSHYRTQQNFTWESLEAAQNSLLNIYAWADRQHQTKVGTLSFEAYLHDIKAALSDDLNTPKAIAILNQMIDQSMTMDAAPTLEVLTFIDNALGLQLGGRPDITEEQKALIAQRQEARQANNYDEADNLRGQLLEDGLELDDTPSGTRWRRTTA